MPGIDDRRRGDDDDGKTAQGHEPGNADIEQPGITPLDVDTDCQDGRDQSEIQDCQGDIPALGQPGTDDQGNGGQEIDKVAPGQNTRPLNRPVGRNSSTMTSITKEIANL